MQHSHRLGLGPFFSGFVMAHIIPWYDGGKTCGSKLWSFAYFLLAPFFQILAYTLQVSIEKFRRTLSSDTPVVYDISDLLQGPRDCRSIFDLGGGGGGCPIPSL